MIKLIRYDQDSNSRHRTRKRIGGVAVVVVLLMIVMIMSFTSAAGLLTKQNYTNAKYREKIMHARYLARAGAATAMHELTVEPEWGPTQAFPYKKTLNAAQGMGFDVWVEGVNADSDATVTTASGEILSKGQAIVHVVPVVDGQRMANAFAGGEQVIRLFKPSHSFDHALFAFHPAEQLKLAANNTFIMSYDSRVGPPPADPAGAAAPLNTSATVRSLQDLMAQGTAIYGHAELPTGSKLSFTNGFSTEPEVKVDEAYPVAQFDAPLGTKDLAVAPNLDAVGFLPPGAYTDLTVPAGQTLRLEYGAKYYFFDNIYLGDNSRVELQGDIANGPTQIYAHMIQTAANCMINIPASPAAPPLPGMLQLYGINQVGCTETALDIGQNSTVAMVSALPNGRLTLNKNSVIYGSHMFRYGKLGDNSKFYYDLSLRGVLQEADRHWMVVGQSNI